MKNLKVGLVGVYQTNFTGDKNAEFEKGRRGLKELSEKLSFDFYCYPEMVLTPSDAQKARQALEDEKIEFVMIQTCSFAAGEVVLPLAKMDAYLGLWAMSEPNKSGVLSLNSFCGLNMFASIITNYLKEYSKKYKWFFGNCEDQMFKDRMEITIRALTAIVNMKKSKVALVGGIAPGFNDLYFDERLIEKRLGVEIQRNNEFSEIRGRAMSYKKSELDESLNTVSCGYRCINENIKDGIELNARVYKAYKDLADENGYDALAVSCWPKMQDEMGMLACSTLGKLNQNGIPSACEGDLPGAVSMLMLKYITNDVSMLMDLVAFDEKDDSVQLWHCGPAAECYANEKGVCLDQFYENGGADYMRRGSMHDMEFKPQAATIMRFTGEWDKMFLVDGKFMDTKKDSFFGSRGWLGELKLNRKDINARDFINTILVQGFQHHYPVIPSDVSEVLMEVAVWLDIKPVQMIEYQNYLQDPQ